MVNAETLQYVCKSYTLVYINIDCACVVSDMHRFKMLGAAGAFLELCLGPFQSLLNPRHVEWVGGFLLDLGKWLNIGLQDG